MRVLILEVAGADTHYSKRDDDGEDFLGIDSSCEAIDHLDHPAIDELVDRPIVVDF